MLEILKFILSSPYNFIGTLIIIFTVGIVLTSIARSFRIFEINKIEIQDEADTEYLKGLKQYFSQTKSSDENKS